MVWEQALRVRRNRRFIVASAVLAITAGIGVSSRVAIAQSADSGRTQQLQREQRLRDLDDFNLDNRIRANELVPVGQRTLIDYGALLSLSYLTVRDRDAETRGERIYELTGYARVNVDGVHEAFVRGRYAYFDYFSENDSFDGRGSRENDDKLDRAYYRFDLGRYFSAYEGKSSDSGLAIQAGRDLVYWANGLVLGQRLDGVLIDATSGPLTMQAIAGVTPDSTVDFDPSRPDFDTDTRRGFYGAIASVTVGAHRPFFYVLGQQDYNDSGPYPILVSGGNTIRSRFRYDSFYVGGGSEGNLGDRMIYAVEAAYEGGNTLSRAAADSQSGQTQLSQQSDPIQAAAINLRLEYLFPDEGKTRLSFEETVATGDEDRKLSNQTYSGNVEGTRDNAFNAFGLINPGLAFSPNLSNLAITRVGIATNPFPSSSWTRRLQVGADFFVYTKLRRFGALDETSAGAGPLGSASVDEPGHYVGFEPDVYLNWQITSDMTFVARYGYFFPGDAISANDNHRQFVYLGVTYAF